MLLQHQRVTIHFAMGGSMLQDVFVTSRMSLTACTGCYTQLSPAAAGLSTAATADQHNLHVPTCNKHMPSKIIGVMLTGVYTL